MKKLILLLMGLGMGMVGLAQNTPPPPDCIFFINITFASATSANIPGTGGYDNTTLGCQTWVVSYAAAGTGALTSIAFQAASGTTTAGTFANWPGTVVTGINPQTSSGNGTATFSTGCASLAACTVANSFVKVVATRGTFVGTVKGVVYGYRAGYPGSGGGGGLTSDVNIKQVGGIATKICEVATGCLAVGGPDVAGTPQVGNPVLVGGMDNLGNVQIVGTDTSRNLIQSGIGLALADGVSNTQVLPAYGGGTGGNRVFSMLFNGATWDRNFACTNSAAITLSAATDAVIVTGVAATTTRICHISFSNGTTVADVTIRQGTGATCGTNTLALSGAYASVTGLALDFGNQAALRTTVAARDVCLHFSTAVTAGGIVTYAQY